jgi:hypothetical protein
MESEVHHGSPFTLQTVPSPYYILLMSTSYSHCPFSIFDLGTQRSCSLQSPTLAPISFESLQVGLDVTPGLPRPLNSSFELALSTGAGRIAGTKSVLWLRDVC